MQKKLEIAELKEKNAMVCIDKFSKLHQKTKVEKEYMDNLVELVYKLSFPIKSNYKTKLF